MGGSFAERFAWPSRALRPLCIAHRGASGHRTENTLAAFEFASALGADMWELDTQLSRDGVVMVSHDDSLLQVFGIDRRISALTAAEIAAVAPVPRFSDVAQLARKLGAGLYVELKAPGSGPLCWRELVLHDQRHACLGSFDAAQLRALREAGCEYPLSILVRLGHDPFALADSTEADIMHLCWERGGERPQDLVSPALLERARRGDREVVLWHEERPGVLADLMAMPVLGICTDLPDLMRPEVSNRVA
jgi:glycerophosphoryl diester phosphodiesterase